MISEEDKIKPGWIKFVNESPPPMVAGKYVIHAQQDIDTNQPHEANVKFARNDIEFHISAPRFRLDPSEVYNVYPPAGTTGDYYNTLPHIVFSRKTLPWERTIDGSTRNETDPATAAPPKPPWMALLLFDEDEIKQYEIKVQSVLLNAIFERPANTDLVMPAFPEPHDPWEIGEMEENAKNINDEGKNRYNVLDIPVELFKAIVPNPSELCLLVHARQVDTGNKEMSGINAKGWFSVIMGNRLPAAKKNNTVYLVSLEGHNGFLGLDDKNKAKIKGKIRLVVLSYWSFIADGLSFEGLVNNLNDQIGWLRINPDTTGITNPFIKNALEMGYTPLNQTFRNGARDVSWYRGPLVPVDIPKPSVRFHSGADELLMLDTTTGMYDISYSAAWQLGRLLALQSGSFSKAINSWKNGFGKKVRMSIARDILEKTLNHDPKNENDQNGDSKDIDRILDKVESDEMMRNLVMEMWYQSI